MSGVKVELDRKFFDKLTRNLSKEKDAMLNEIGLFIQSNVRAQISSKGLVDTGNLRRSIHLDTRSTGRGGVAIVGTNAIYALPLELGMSRRFFPSKDMIAAITLWSKRKLGLSEAEAKKAGPAIAISIGRKGLDPKRFPARYFEAGFNVAARRIPSLLDRFVRRAAAMTAPTSR